jgi:hypothetical protein
MGNCTSINKHDTALPEHDTALPEHDTALPEHDTVPANLIIAYARVIVVLDEISRIINKRGQEEIETFNKNYDLIFSEFRQFAMIHDECKVDSDKSNEIHAAQKEFIAKLHDLTIRMQRYKKLLLTGDKIRNIMKNQ